LQQIFAHRCLAEPHFWCNSHRKPWRSTAYRTLFTNNNDKYLQLQCGQF
jgi:hypothetical protein